MSMFIFNQKLASHQNLILHRIASDVSPYGLGLVAPCLCFFLLVTFHTVIPPSALFTLLFLLLTRVYQVHT